MGTQKNRLNETVLLSTQNRCLNLWVRKYLQFYAQKLCLFKLVILYLFQQGDACQTEEVDDENKSIIWVLLKQVGLPQCTSSLVMDDKNKSIIWVLLKQVGLQQCTSYLVMDDENKSIIWVLLKQVGLQQCTSSLVIMFGKYLRERSGSVVKCLTWDRGAAGLSLTGATALCPWARHINPSLVLFPQRKTHPYITERLLMGCKESNQTNKIGIYSHPAKNSQTTWKHARAELLCCVFEQDTLSAA